MECHTNIEQFASDLGLSTEYEEREEGSHESPCSREGGEERTVETHRQPDEETGHQAVDGKHLAHTVTHRLSVFFSNFPDQSKLSLELVPT